MDFGKIKMSKKMGIGISAVILGTGTLTWLNLRPVGVLFILYFAAWFYKTHFTNIKIQLPPSLIDKLQQQFNRIAELRQQQPTKFCIVMCCSFINLAFIGHIFTPTWIVVILLVSAVFISNKYQIKIVTEERQEITSYTLQPIVETENDEFLPDVSDEANMLLLRSVGDHADVTSLYPIDVKDEEDEKNELEFYNDQLVSQDNRLLDIEEDMSESDDDDDDIIIPDEKITNEITFKSGHFNVDSSSDDDSISRGLNFNNVCTTETDSTGTTQKPQPPQQQPITSILQNISLVPLLLEKIKNTTIPDNVKEQGNMKKTSQEKRRLLASDSEEDSDFEFLNVDEMEDL